MTDIAQLFLRDPLLCSDTDIEALVADFRSKRHLFNQGVTQAGNTKKLAPKIDLPKLTIGSKKL